MTPQQTAHEKLVEDVAREMCAFAGMNPSQPDRLGNPAWEGYKSGAESLLRIIASRLSEVTPEMATAWFHTRTSDKRNRMSAAKADWRAMLAASCLTPPK